MSDTNTNKKKSSILKRVTIDLPKNYVDIVDEYCRDSLATRRKWFYDAMVEKLERDKLCNSSN